MDKFLGLGLGNIFGLFLLFCLLIIVSKVALTKYQIPGVSEAVLTI